MSFLKRITRPFRSDNVKDEALQPAFQYHDAHLPTLWLLGKTGSGKSTLIQSITGNAEAEVGNGFKPCTRTARQYGFPQQKPILQFLDTRGLGEAGYDPSEDIQFCSTQGHALIVVMKVGDTEQSETLQAIRKIHASGKIRNFLLVHTASHLVLDEQERERLIQFNREQVKQAYGQEMQSVSVDFKLSSGGVHGVDCLVQELTVMLPIVAVLAIKRQGSDAEAQRFLDLHTQVLWYSGVAGVSDVVPGIGVVAVPGIQWKMLHDLATQYGMQWNKAALGELLGALGAGIGFRYSLKFGTRQVVKFLPGWGQTVGAASAAVMSFCTTYAMGRVACKYMFHKCQDEVVSKEELRDLFHSAFDSVKTLAKEDLPSESQQANDTGDT